MSERKYWWTCGSGRIEIELPEQAVVDCHHQGACDADVAHWQPILGLNLDRSIMIEELEEYGAWTTEELENKSNDELEEIIIWLAAGDLQDDPESDFNKEREVQSE